ncbi:DUF3040 domain-containing protein [Mycolicibacterium celeriflavum]|uniref:Uncharacterized protein n=1 Tax=Mycolicibacterium celeriflavum TaxID=1249101 RepID=A0A1X0C0B1_MYCCF|nr:DUF3040 domain-containing protein [Mycolicibacterium celeriflavum]ORA50475.1 hypothetical protein BST21_04435 [Mycolicibacterium celeriflavum]BBY45210.1 hypothetical protein MCEL_35050 [Mycolicibacterium celeriflavum]
MISEDERRALRAIERRLRWENPDLVRLFSSEKPPLTVNLRQPARGRALLAAAAITGLLLLGPRILTEAEVRTRRRAPLPCADILSTLPSTVVTPPCRAA